MSSVMARFVRRLESPFVTIRVGQGAGTRDFHVPQDILCACSVWFTNALKQDRFIEGAEKLIKLPEESAATFEAFIAFAYEGLISFKRAGDMSTEARGEAFQYVLDIWNFGEKYMLPHLQDAATTTACSFLHCRDGVPWDVLGHCFEVATTECPFRTIIADYAAQCMHVQREGAGPAIERHLGSADGFITAFCASQLALRSLPVGHFPRYGKPLQAGAELYKTDGHDGEWREGFEEELGYGGSWAIPYFDCGECGLYHSDRLDASA
ncbi:unnamed protein product [Zymoseptoria tritici ST99CH_1A5]|uniref:BTB domain-containing protein n=1 Tax=Zymoseptoria tritici ST99CH_1A5 TaxID=1276529 RepID=A0A1Y6LD88_ZYMTR|nr:unnamed protein product [Zymoseptoria tritici ST99CH_1A5]